MPRWNLHFDTHVDYTRSDLIQCIAEAKAKASVMRGLPLPPAIQRSIDRLNIMRAVRGTTGIEGVELSEDEVDSIMNSPSERPVLPETRKREEMEVRNAHRLMTYIEESRWDQAELSEELIKEFHYIITDGVEYERNIPGEYRDHPVRAGDYQAPLPEDIPALMGSFIEWFNHYKPKDWDPLVRAVVAHFYLISIHPFGDGNGRTSRGIESYLLYKAGINTRGFYSLANYYYKNRPEYIDMLDHVRFITDPDLTPFVQFGLNGLLEELSMVHEQIIDAMKRISFRDYCREILDGIGRLNSKVGNRQLRLISDLIDHGPTHRKDIMVSAQGVKSLYRGLTEKTLSRDISALVELGLIEVNDSVVHAMIDIMDRFTATSSPEPVMSH